MTEIKYEYKAFVERVIDGDTFDAFVILADHGFKHYVMTIDRFRLFGIDTPELHGIDKALGELAKKRTEELILHKWVTLNTLKDPEKYGRWLTTVMVDGTDLVKTLIAEGHVKKPVVVTPA